MIDCLATSIHFQLVSKLKVTNSSGVSLVRPEPRARTSIGTKTDKQAQLWMNAWDTMRPGRLHLSFDLWARRLLRPRKNQALHLGADLLWAQSDGAYSLLLLWRAFNSRAVILSVFFSSSSVRGRAGVNEEGHPRVSPLKAIAAFFIFWHCAERRPHPVSGARVYTGAAAGVQATVRCCLSPTPPEFYSLCEASLKLSRIYPVLMPLGVTVWVDRERWRGGRGGRSY